MSDAATPPSDDPAGPPPGAADEADRSTASTTDEALEALQAAARQAITAARGLLDAAEVALQDPRLVREAVGALGDMAREAARQAARAASPTGRPPGTPGAASCGGSPDADDAGAPRDPGEGPVQRIPLE